MKTTTILNAMERALELHNHYSWMLKRHPRQESYDIIADRKARQHYHFRAALFRRIEAGDRAREELAEIKATQKEQEKTYLEWLEGMQ